MEKNTSPEKEILLTPLANGIVETCERIRELIMPGYDYSITKLLSEVERIMRTIEAESEESRKLIREYLAKAEYARKLLNLLETNIVLYQSMIKVFQNARVAQEDLRAVIGFVPHYIRLIYRDAIKVFVDASREAGSIDAYIFDRYGQFKVKWNKILTDFEHEVSQYLPKIEDLSQYLAPDLGVQVKTK